MEQRLTWLIVLVFITVTMLTVIQFYLLISLFNEDYENLEDEIYQALFEASYEINKSTSSLGNREEGSLNIELYRYYRLPEEELFSENNAFVEEFPSVNERLVKSALGEHLEPLNYNLKYEYGVYYPALDSLLISSNLVYIQELKNSTFTAPIFIAETNNRVFLTIYVKGIINRILVDNLFWYLSIFLTLLAIVVLYIFLYKEILYQRKLSVLKEDFVANITHELKTPLSSSLLALERLRKEGESFTEKKRRKFIEIIYSESKKLNSLIERILDSSGIRENQFELNPVGFQLIVQLEEIVKDYERRAFDKEIAIRLHYKSRPEIKADLKLFKILTSSIIDNSIKYSVKKVNIDIALEHGNSGLNIFFKDSGQGISEEYVGVVFDKFFRIPNKEVHDVKGHGLGLFYVKNIVEKHGWEIDLISKENEGTTVCISIPNRDVIK
ncbi:MAG: HAMP domain-containing histidine kinase [Balneolaceae bacterium]|nr:HAMP domain-containing histidine kinase [Balneolaceae bacterium]MBO6544876.1 HAMP domain-containing histidine kinase [Balneolaceae bacterium]MBO6646272.1 HAMP domain-containing histidine kinase [Balneolaceae bacterium]